MHQWYNCAHVFQSVGDDVRTADFVLHKYRHVEGTYIFLNLRLGTMWQILCEGVRADWMCKWTLLQQLQVSCEC